MKPIISKNDKDIVETSSTKINTDEVQRCISKIICHRSTLSFLSEMPSCFLIILLSLILALAFYFYFFSEQKNHVKWS